MIICPSHHAMEIVEILDIGLLTNKISLTCVYYEAV